MGTILRSEPSRRRGLPASGRLEFTSANTIQDLAMSLFGAAGAVLVISTVLWPPGGTPVDLFGWA